MRTTVLDRRTFLRGAGGVGLALPFLEAMLPRRASAATAPMRYVVCFAGMSLGRDNAGKLTDIVPDGSGAAFTLRSPMAPLAPLQKDLLVVSGLRIPIGGTGGRLDGFHKTSISPLLSGTTPVDIGPNCNGVTSDQIVAADPAFASKTRFPFLSLRVQADAYRGGGNVGVISWKARGQKNDPTVSPSLAFNNLFGSFMPPATGGGGVDTAAAAAMQRARRQDLSVLDLVGTNATRLQTRLGAADRARLERHFDELRALEQRLRTIPAAPPPAAGGGGGCQVPSKPGTDPATMNVFSDEVGDNIGYSGEDQRAQVLTGLLARSLVCDQVRVATLQYTCVQCFMNVEPLVGVKMDLHEMAHLSNVQGGKDIAQQKVMEMYGWHMKHFASLASQLKAEIGPDGNPLLDSTVLVFVNEGGLGPAEGKNPASHSTDNMMALVVGGRAGGLKLGRHLATSNEHPARVLTSAMNAAGVQAAGLGDVRGRLESMFTA
jgi:hypothetical protein